MTINGFHITAKNIINKYNNSIYETYETAEEESLPIIGIYNAS